MPLTTRARCINNQAYKIAGTLSLHTATSVASQSTGWLTGGYLPRVGEIPDHPARRRYGHSLSSVLPGLAVAAPEVFAGCDRSFYLVRASSASR